MNDNPWYGLQCPKCRDIIFSEHRHDFRRCKCGAIFVDGGKDYLRYGWDNGIEKDDIMLVVRGEENITNDPKC